MRPHRRQLLQRRSETLNEIVAQYQPTYFQDDVDILEGFVLNVSRSRGCLRRLCESGLRETDNQYEEEQDTSRHIGESFPVRSC